MSGEIVDVAPDNCPLCKWLLFNLGSEKRHHKVENIENLLDTSDVHVQNLSDNTRQMKKNECSKRKVEEIHS